MSLARIENEDLSLSDTISRLSSTGMFGTLDLSVLKEILPEFERIRLPGGDTLFRRGDPGDALYVILSGRLRVTAESARGGQEILREVGLGESVGELAILTGQPRSATVRAIRDTELLKLSSSSVDRLLQKHPQIALQLTRLVAAREMQGPDSSATGSHIRTIAVCGCGDSAPVSNFIEHLVQALQNVGATVHLNSRGIGNRFGELAYEAIEQDRDQSGIIAWLNDMEATHRFVIYETDPQSTRWTRLCFRQADRILVVMSAQMDVQPLQPKLNEWLPSGDTAIRAEMVFLHDEDREAITGTERRLSQFKVEAHHHINTTCRADFERLARTLAGNDVGLVLSGGGARGFAHIGVIRALTEAGIPLDCVGGTSMGALIAAQHALGWDWQTMAKRNKEYWNRYNPHKDYTVPFLAITSGRKLTKMLREMYGDVQIEDLKTKFFCVSSNLTRAEIVVHRKGSLRSALRASLSIPGIGPPVFLNGDLLVDGGLLNNLPVDILKNACRGAVFASDATERIELTTNLHNTEALSGWRLLWRRLNPIGNRLTVPNIFTILLRTTMLNSVRLVDSAKSQADFYFNPPVKGFGMFDWQNIDAIVEIGYLFAIRKLEEMAEMTATRIRLQKNT
jgi:predicted acylesterase/phospholipase RssA